MEHVDVCVPDTYTVTFEPVDVTPVKREPSIWLRNVCSLDSDINIEPTSVNEDACLADTDTTQCYPANSHKNVCSVLTQSKIKTEPPDWNNDVPATGLDDVSHKSQAKIKSEPPDVRDDESADSQEYVCSLQPQTTVKSELRDFDVNGKNANSQSRRICKNVYLVQAQAKIKTEAPNTNDGATSNHEKLCSLEPQPKNQCEPPGVVCNDAQHEVKNEHIDLKIEIEIEPRVLAPCKVDPDHDIGWSHCLKRQRGEAGTNSSYVSDQDMTDKLLFTCNFCMRSFRFRRSLVKHLRTHTGDRLYACNNCNRTFPCKSNLARHKLTHSGARPYTCDICNKTYRDTSHLSSHKLTHTNERPFACDICDRKFTQKSHLNSHKFTHTNERPFSCDICQKQFPQKFLLISHRQTHSSDWPFVCVTCGKKFVREDQFTKHTLTHTSSKSFVCDICDKKFKQECNLITHTSIHTNEQRFACNICDKKFTRKTHLNSHRYTHASERPFACGSCNKRFTQRSHLNVHLYSHTGERPFSCDVCNKSFLQKSHLNTHKLSH